MRGSLLTTGDDTVAILAFPGTFKLPKPGEAAFFVQGFNAIELTVGSAVFCPKS